MLAILRTGLVAALVLVLPVIASAQNAGQNKQLVQKAFDNWANGKGSIFDLVADDVQWTLTGNTPLSRTYTSKRELMQRLVEPLNERLAQPIVPTIRNLVAEGDVVVAVWDGKATAMDGQRYDVTYAWHMMLSEGKIVHVIAFQDVQLLADLMQRIAAK